MIFLVILLVVLVAWIGLVVHGYLKGIEKELTTIRQYLQKDSIYANISIPAQAEAWLAHIGQSRQSEWKRPE
ncbi:hypothetical protein [Thermomonas sp.]|uniref:hypothetical protein n=1 Tax=Thermomonas sp. TaxID=1971895 RepID=UPI0039198229